MKKARLSGSLRKRKRKEKVSVLSIVNFFRNTTEQHCRRLLRTITEDEFDACDPQAMNNRFSSDEKELKQNSHEAGREAPCERYEFFLQGLKQNPLTSTTRILVGPRQEMADYQLASSRSCDGERA
jgi:hypothetical protein